MTLIVLRSIQQFTKLFNRKLLPLWALVWISLHHPLRYYNPFPPPSLSLLHWGRSTLLPLSQLPCLPPADFMHPLCSPLTFLYSLTTFPISLLPGKVNNSSLWSHRSQANSFWGTPHTRLQLSISVSWHMLFLSFYINSSTMCIWHRRYLGFPFPFFLLPGWPIFQEALSPFGEGGEGKWETPGKEWPLHLGSWLLFSTEPIRAVLG